MSIRALHYITGDTPNSGFRRIGSSDAFPADQLLLLNNGETIQERSRIETSSSRPSGGGIRQMSEVWEYQTGKFGTPVVIHSIAAIGTGRSHAFSEYILGMTDRVTETADAGDLIRGADKLTMLDVKTFMTIPGREEISCPEETWEPEKKGTGTDEKNVLDEQWRLTLLSRYWQQASVRAFSEDTPETVRVNLGEFSEDLQEETEETIRHAKSFFADVICPGLPRQVQNIASMAAGVNCADTVNLYTALEFDITPNMFADETLMIRRPRELRKYRLNAAELEFMAQVSGGETPEAVQKFFERYIQLSDNKDATEETTPFMADYRVWYTLYCLDRIVREGHAFIEKADLYKEHGNPKNIRDARACFLLMRRMRKYLETDHRLNETNRKTLVTELLEPIEKAAMQVMLENMNEDNAEPFMLFRNEKTEFFRRYLYNAPEDQLQLMIDLTVRDQQVSKAPQFVRCYPAVPLRNETADIRNAEMMRVLLPAVIRPLIDEENKKGKIENKYLEQLRSEEFADRWACLPQNERTRRAFAEFFRGEVQDPQKHFLLYKISLKYLPSNELLQTTLKHLTAENTEPGNRPDERQLKIAAHGAKEFISGKGRTDQACVSAMNRYYQACFRNYRGSIGNISDIVEQLGGDTTEAMAQIFGEAASGKRITEDEARAVFSTFGGESGEYAGRDEVRNAYSAMIAAQRDAVLQRIGQDPGQDPEQTRESLVEWIAGMAEAAPFPVDTSDSMRALFENAREGTRINKSTAATIFRRLMPHAADSGKERITSAYSAMMTEQLNSALAKQDNSIIDWISGMIAASGDAIAIDTTESLKKIFESAKTGEKIRPADASAAFDVMGRQASSMDTTVLRTFTEMLATRRNEARENRDPAGFDWQCEMLERCPWKDNKDWLDEQRTENTILVCDISTETEKPVDGASLATIQHWLEQNSIQTRGMNRLQNYCEFWLKKENSVAAEMFLRYFGQIDERCVTLRNHVFDQVKARFISELERSQISFGDLINSCRADTERSGKRLDDLYNETKEPVETFLQQHFETTSDLGYLINEQEQLPEKTEFYRSWLSRLSEKIYHQQVELFNRQPNLDKIMNLRSDILKRSREIHPALKAAYELIDGYEGILTRISERSEYGAITEMGNELRDMNNTLDRASDVRKTLCSSLRSVNYPAQKKLREQSFRHALCGTIIQAALTESGTGSHGGKKGCPDWNYVINSLFTRAELDDATKKPYAKGHVRVLQRLLAMVENVKLMSAYGMDPEWTEELIKVIHTNPVMHSYQNALARNRKMSEMYQLNMTGDGLSFD